MSKHTSGLCTVNQAGVPVDASEIRIGQERSAAVEGLCANAPLNATMRARGRNTPGPWYAVNGNVYSHTTRREVALCRAEVDAPLIAAAPELLAAVAAMLPYYAACAVGPEHERIVERARNAIAVVDGDICDRE